MNSQLVEHYKINWCQNWMSAWKIQRWWRRNKLLIQDYVQDYIRQVQTNYCHRLELLFYAIHNRDLKNFIEIPEYLYANVKFKELIDRLSSESYIFNIIPGLNYRYNEKYINYFAARYFYFSVEKFLTKKDGMIVTDRIIFISRKDSKKRRIHNEQQVIDFLKTRIPKLEVVSFNNESSAIEQAEMFSRCLCLIGLHGAGLANLFWMIRNHLDVSPMVYEITPKGYFYHDFKKKAENRDLKHRYIEIQDYIKSEESLVYPRDSILTISSKELEKMEDQLIEDNILIPERDFRYAMKIIPTIYHLDECTKNKMCHFSF
jgi:hypothetical protein